MFKKTMVILLVSSLALTVACESELDGKTAATVHEATEAVDESAEKEAEEEQEAYREVAFNKETSKIEWLGAKVTGDHDGGFKEWDGLAKVNAENGLEKVKFTVDTTSLWSDNDRLTGHLKNDDFFDVEKYPEAKFISSSIKEGVEGEAEGTHTVTGDMTIKDQTKTISFPVTAAVDDNLMKIDSEFTLMRFDFGVDFKGQADDLIRDEVLMKLSFELPLDEEAVAEEAAEEVEETDEG